MCEREEGRGGVCACACLFLCSHFTASALRQSVSLFLAVCASVLALQTRP